MNKAELLDSLETRLGSRKAAADAVEAIVDVIVREVAAGGSVGITGFGTFERADRAARTGRNPRTGQTVRIEATRAPKFRPGTQFKDVVADPALLPADGVVGVRAATPRAAAPATKAAPKKAAPRKDAAKADKTDKTVKATDKGKTKPKADKKAKKKK